MLILEYDNVDCGSSDIDRYFERLLGLYFHRFECKTVTKKDGMYNGVIITNVGIGKMPSYISRYATRIIDTFNWGFLKNTTSVKRITEEMKEEYLIILLTTPELKF